ncbi:septin-7-like isoform X2 [Ornithodoros turicata]|uniref:septin-7-like isoform X2 n=1 Tax=Ornithodoros turicata TaxID=34597 RepID=UPI0031389425
MEMDSNGALYSVRSGSLLKRSASSVTPPTEDARATMCALGSGSTESAVRRPLLSSSGLGYRYAGLDRFVNRPRVYESLTDVVQNDVSPQPTLSSKRELFFRDGPSAVSTGGTTGAASLLGSGAALTSTNVASLSNTNTSKSQKELTSSGGYGDTGSLTTTGSSSVGSKDVEGSYVGFASLPDQVYRKAVKKGFEFTLMVVGESGLGKSTLINSMFLTDIYSNEYPGPSHRVKKTVEVETTRVVLREGGVNLTLTIVDTPGFGDAVDNTQCWQPIIDYVEAKYAEYLDAESRVHRSTVPDNRVHCCLYFIMPSGHGLKPLNIEFMKRLHDKVNIIPIIAKADTMTPEECSLFKRTILNEIAQNKIRLYEFPECDDDDENKHLKGLKERVPFAVVGSNTIVEVNGKRVRGRKYPWGVAEVENMEHCDFIALRNMLIRTHMQDLKDITNNVHYENFRCRKLAGVGGGGDGGSARSNNSCSQRILNTQMVFWNPLAQMEEEKKDHDAKMQRMEKEMEQVFEMKVREKMQKLKESEADLQRRHEQMKKSLEQQRQELEEKRRNFDKEKASFELTHKDFDDVLRKMSADTNSKEQLDGKEKRKEKKKGLF